MTTELAKNIRKNILNMVYRAKASHAGSSLSIADILAVLYENILNVDAKNPDFKERDRFILSKGHAATALYAVLAEKEFFPKEWLDKYCENDQLLSGHISHYVPGVDFSTGSLGHGLPIACGVALAKRTARSPARVFALLSDGECDEGSNWEAMLFAGHHGLDNLVLIIDYNKIQSFGRVEDVLDLEPFADKLRAFKWNVQELDGHNHEALQNCFANLPAKSGMPTAIIAHTVKGQGVSFMENKLLWHYKSPTEEQFQEALEELEAQP